MCSHGQRPVVAATCLSHVVLPGPSAAGLSYCCILLAGMHLTVLLSLLRRCRTESVGGDKGMARFRDKASVFVHEQAVVVGPTCAKLSHLDHACATCPEL